MPGVSRTSQGVIQTSNGVISTTESVPDNAVDNFEKALYEDKGNSLSDYYVGDLSKFQRQQNVVHEGDLALECSTDSNVGIAANEGSGLPNYVQAGDTLESTVRIASGSRRLFTHIRAYDSGDGYQVDDSYRCRLDLDAGEIGIVGVQSESTFNPSDSTSVSISGDTFYKQLIQFQSDDTMVYSLEDTTGTELGQVSIQDGTLSHVGVGMTAETNGTGEKFYWDNLQLV